MSESKTILIADDDRRNRNLLQGMLESFGYLCEQAEDGVKALSKLSHEIDLILLDVMMPGMDGFEVARRIRGHSDFGDLPIIMVTVLTSKEDRLQAVEAGANDFISKPIDKLELQVRTASLLKMKEVQDAIKKHRDELEVMVEKRTAALRETEQRFRAIFETAEDCIFIKDTKLRYTLVNPSMETLFGLPAAKLVGMTDSDIFGSDAGNRNRDVDLRVLAGEFIEEEQTRFLAGIPITFHEIRMPMVDSSGKITGLFGIARNITDRKGRTAPLSPVESEYPSPAMRSTLNSAQLAAQTDSIILITGESGCGKDYLARYIHDHSKRSTGPFFLINCAAVAPEIAESELFGHEAGAFTGAHRRKKGLLELAEGGTLLLNEIGDLPPHLQAKLLSFLDSRSLTRVGGERSISVSARLIAATNKDLEQEVENGNFRADLFHRLNVLSIPVPPLRERIEDIPILIASLIAELSTTMQIAEVKGIEEASLKRLKRYDWPGNVRELRNVLERSLILSQGGSLRVDLPSPDPTAPDDWSWFTGFPSRQSLNDVTKDLKRSLIEEALRRSNGNKSLAAKLLNITRAALKRQMQTLGFYGQS